MTIGCDSLPFAITSRLTLDIYALADVFPMEIEQEADCLPSYCFGTVLRCREGAIFGEKELQCTS
jgi:hypothetical protein